jgi:hypothetical protein
MGPNRLCCAVFLPSRKPQSAEYLGTRKLTPLIRNALRRALDLLV